MHHAGGHSCLGPPHGGMEACTGLHAYIPCSSQCMPHAMTELPHSLLSPNMCSLGGELPPGWSALVVRRSPASRTFESHPWDLYFFSPDAPTT